MGDSHGARAALLRPEALSQVGMATGPLHGNAANFSMELVKSSRRRDHREELELSRQGRRRKVASADQDAGGKKYYRRTQGASQRPGLASSAGKTPRNLLDLELGELRQRHIFGFRGS